jgi:hypothetical protein
MIRQKNKMKLKFQKWQSYISHDKKNGISIYKENNVWTLILLIFMISMIKDHINLINQGNHSSNSVFSR